MSLDVLVPFRAATEHRQALHDYTWTLWRQLMAERPDVNVIVASDGQHGDLFNLSRAVNRAYRNGNGESVLIFGSGHLPPPAALIGWITDHLTVSPWLGAYAGVRYLSQADTALAMRGEPTDAMRAVKSVERCTGIMAMRRDVLRDVGGMDERFNGWGYEDTALRYVLTDLYGEPPTPTATLTTLWHPPAPRRGKSRNRALYREYVGSTDLRAYLDRRGNFL